jgi:tetratricopeptide (TPR) repeat protein
MYNYGMNRNLEFEHLKKLLSVWEVEINFSNRNNENNINVYSEDLVAKLLNLAYGYNLKNLNPDKTNHEAIDLGDLRAGIAFQVSSTCKKGKIDETLEKFKKNKHDEKYPNGLYIFFLKLKIDKYKPETKERWLRENQFDAGKQIMDLNTFYVKTKELFNEKRKHYDAILQVLEEEFGGFPKKKKNLDFGRRNIRMKACGMHTQIQEKHNLNSAVIDSSSSQISNLNMSYCSQTHQVFLEISLNDKVPFEKFLPTLDLAGLQSKKRDENDNRSQTQVLTRKERKVLGLVALSIFPIKKEYLSKFFPEISWGAQIGKFEQDGLLVRKNNRLELSTAVKKKLLDDPLDIKEFCEGWIAVLEPLKHHSDIPRFLSFYYFKQDRNEDAINVLSDIVCALEPGYENKIYLSYLDIILEKRVLAKLKVESRFKFYNMMGLCYSREGNYLEAIDWFLKSLRYSQRIRDFEWAGESYINCGVSYHELNKIEKAEKCFRKALECADKNENDWLRARALHNLAIELSSQNLDESEALFNESLKIKETLEDVDGIISTYLELGNLSYEKAAFKDALKWYKKGEKKSKEYNFTYLHSLTLLNIGIAYWRLDNSDAAIEYFHRAMDISQAEGYHYTLSLALKNEANLRFDLKDYTRAEKLYRELYELIKSQEDSVEILEALHNIGAVLIKLKKYKDARQVLGKGLRLARKKNEVEWIYDFHIAAVASYSEAEEEFKARDLLRKYAKEEEKNGLYFIAGKLWETLLGLLYGNEVKKKIIENTFNRCIYCFRKVKNHYPHLVRVYEERFAWSWENNSTNEAMEILKELEKISSSKKKITDKIRYINQKGVCYYELEMFDAAENVFKCALRKAKRLGDHNALIYPLHNLGVLYQTICRFDDSIQMSSEAKLYAEKIDDWETVINISCILATTYRMTGNLKKSENLLLACKAKAKDRKMITEGILTMYELALFAEISGKRTLAERRYLRALKKAIENELENYTATIIAGYIDFLRKDRRYDEALRLLENHKEVFIDQLGSPSFYISKALIYEDNGSQDLAIKSWEEAQKEATQLGDRESISECNEVLERLNSIIRKSNLSEEYFENQIQIEGNAKNKMKLLLEYTTYLLNSNSSKKAEEFFYYAEGYAIENNFNDVLLELYKAGGDYFWRKNNQSRFLAIKLYISALIYSIDSKENIIDIGIYIISQLLTIEPQKRFSRVQALEMRLSKWLSEEESDEFSEIIESVLWPLKVVMGLPPIISEAIPDRQIYFASERIISNLAFKLKQ